MSWRIELTAGGRARGFALRLPRTGAGDGIPLVIVLHGNHPDATGQLMRDWTTFDEQADAFGFAVAYPGAAETGPREFDAAEEICRFAGPLLSSAESRRL